MKYQSKAHTIVTISQKVAGLKACIAESGQSLKNSSTIEALLDGILNGIAEESAALPKLKLVK